jgi:DNA-binding CsgD family transcriptional regulator
MSEADPTSTSPDLVDQRALDLLGRHPVATAGTILWRSTGLMAWSDGCAQQLVAGGQPGLAELLAGDARSLGRGGCSVLVERIVPARGGTWVRARTSACPGVTGVEAVTTLEVVRAVVATATDLAGKFQLSEKELQIAVLVSEGLGNRAISYRVDLAVPTVGMYLTRIFRKTGTLDRQDLTRLMLTGVPDSTGLSQRAPYPAPPPTPAPPPAPVAAAQADPLPAAASPPGAWRQAPARRSRSGGSRRWRGP